MSDALMNTVALMFYMAGGVALAIFIYGLILGMQVRRHAKDGGFITDARRSAYAEDTERRVDSILHRLASYDVDADKLVPPRKVCR